MKRTKSNGESSSAWLRSGSNRVSKESSSSREPDTASPPDPKCVESIAVELGKLIAKHLAADESRSDDLKSAEDRSRTD